MYECQVVDSWQLKKVEAGESGLWELAVAKEIECHE